MEDQKERENGLMQDELNRKCSINLDRMPTMMKLGAKDTKQFPASREIRGIVADG